MVKTVLNTFLQLIKDISFYNAIYRSYLILDCYESGVYHNNGDSWTSSDLNTSCTCECPEDELLGCVTKCKKHTVV